MAFGIKRKKLSDDKLLKVALSQLSSAEKHMAEVVESAEYARQVLKGSTHPDYGKSRNPNDPKDWESREFPPIAYEHAELLNAEMTLENPRFDFTALKTEFFENADRAEDALDYFLDRDRFPRTYRLATKAAIRDGASIVWTGWAPDNQPMFNDDGSPKRDEDGNQVFDKRGGKLRAMLTRLEDNFPDPTATCESQASFWFLRSYATTDDLHSRLDGNGKPFYSNLNKLEDKGSSGGDAKKRDDETQEAHVARTTGMHTLHTRWTPYGRLVIANKSVIIRRDDELPMKHGQIPVTVIRLIDNEDSMFGVSPIGLIGSLQMLWWFYFNKLADAVHLAVKPPFAADVEEDPNAANQTIYPNAVLHARGGSQTIKVIEDVTQLSKYDVLQILDLIRNLMERITGMNSTIAGQGSADSATEYAGDLRQGKGRSGAMMDVSDECWSEFANIAYQTIQQYASQSVKAKLSGIEGREVGFEPENLVDMMISPKRASNERALKDLERQDTEAAMGMVLELAEGQGAIPQVSVEPLMEKWLDGMGVDPKDVIIGPPLPPPQEEPPMPAPQGGSPQGGPDSTPMDASGADPDVLDEYGQPLPGAPG